MSRRWEPPRPTASLKPRSGRPPKNWANVTVREGDVVVRLRGWRRLVAISRGVRVPASSVIAVRHDPTAHSAISTRIRGGGRRRLWRLGTFHGRDGWSYWACGVGQNAVVIETIGTRYRYVIVEVREPLPLVSQILEASGLGDPAHTGPQPQPPAETA